MSLFLSRKNHFLFGCILALCSGCGTGACAKVGTDEGVCLCVTIGTYCVGLCSGTLTDIGDGAQSCEGEKSTKVHRWCVLRTSPLSCRLRVELVWLQVQEGV